MAQDTPTRIVLGGSLGKRFGAEWNLHLSSPSVAEAVRAIDANTKGEFRRYLQDQGTKRFYKVALARKDNLLQRDELTQPTGRGTIYILPTVKGREKAGEKILAAVAIAVITYFTAGAGSAGAAGLFGKAAGAVATAGYGAAASLAIGGVVQLLTPVPSFDQNNLADDGRGGGVFQGNASAVSQGAALSLVYGRALVSPMPISLSFTAVDRAIVNSYAPQEYETVIGEGGIVTYVPIETNPDDNLPDA